MNEEHHFWEDLLLYLEQRTVIPLIGQDLLTVEYKGRTVNLYRLLAEKLAEDLGFSPNQLPLNFTLSQVVAAHPRFREKRSLIYSHTKAIFDRTEVAVPEPLRWLARIPAFRVFITTTFDPWMDLALRRERSLSSLNELNISYSPSERTTADLSVEQLTSADPVVYQLFGRICPSPHYAVTEEDSLEYLHCLQVRPPKNLCDVLSNHHLLFIGNSFPDWLARFFVRTVRGERFTTQRGKEVFIVDDELRRSESLVSFFQGFCWETNILPNNTPIEFVRKLHDRWFERHPEAEPPLEIDSGVTATPQERSSHSIFLSYASEDSGPSERLCETLKAAGLHVWMDQRGGLKAGDLYERKIERHVRHCTLFMPVLSRNAEHRREGFFRKEWSLALRRLQDFTGSTRQFLIPAVVDAVNIQAMTNVPPEFKSVQAMIAPDGLPSVECVTRLRDLVRAIVKAEGVGL